MVVLMTTLTALLVLAFLAVLAFALVQISDALRAIGGTPTSYLAKLRMGLRAIERETSHLAPQVRAINDGLTQVGAGLGSVERHLAGTVQAVVDQER